MRVLMISKALVAGTSQRKLEELAKCPGVELDAGHAALLAQRRRQQART